MALNIDELPLKLLPPHNSHHPGLFCHLWFQPSTFNQTCWMCRHCCQPTNGLDVVSSSGDVNVWHKLGCFGQQLCPLCCLIKSWCFLPTTFCCSFVHLEGNWHCQSSLHRSSTSTMYNGNVTPLIASTHPSFTMMMPPPIIDWLVPPWDHDLQVDDKQQ